jgi:hypothetical protein
MRVEIGSQIRDDGVGEAELVQDVIDEANHSIYREFCNWPLLDPLHELVDGYQHMSKTSCRSCQGPYYVQTSAFKRP